MNTDATVWQSAQNILRSQGNLNKLCESFDLIECSSKDLVIDYEDEDDAEGDFIQPVWNFYYAVKASNRRNARTIGWLTIAVQLTCDNAHPEWNFGRRSKAIVGYSPFSDFDETWSFDQESPDAAGRFEDCTTTSTHWEMIEDRGTSWFYAIPLDELTSSDAVRELIVGPTHAILRGAAPAKVLDGISGRICQPPVQI